MKRVFQSSWMKSRREYVRSVVKNQVPTVLRTVAVVAVAVVAVVAVAAAAAAAAAAVAAVVAAVEPLAL